MANWVFDPESADEQGLVGVGADLEPETLVSAYSAGVFPTRFEPYSDPRYPMFWWSPDPRAIFELDQFHISRRLARTIQSKKFTVTFDRDFLGVIRGCGDRPFEGTWITDDMIDAYCTLHQLGMAHSVEVYFNERLVGGTYGVAIGGLFAAESMFHYMNDTSKIALAALVGRLRDRGYVLFDIQMLTPHTQSLGACDIPRSAYLERLREALKLSIAFA